MINLSHFTRIGTNKKLLVELRVMRRPLKGRSSVFATPSRLVEACNSSKIEYGRPTFQNLPLRLLTMNGQLHSTTKTRKRPIRYSINQIMGQIYETVTVKHIRSNVVNLCSKHINLVKVWKDDLSHLTSNFVNNLIRYNR